MQLITLASAAVLVATASAATLFNLNDTCNEDQPLARVHNRCSYSVNLWSVLKGQGCPSGDGALLEPGQIYQENFRPAVNGVGTSIKISKSSKCSGVDIAQLEYYLETNSPGYNYNYLDVSYVDCSGGECPTRQEGFYLKSGNTASGEFMANAANEICPILSCDDPDSCDKCAYVDPNDRQTKSCSPDANLEFYLCGGEAPGSEASETPEPVVSHGSPATSTPAPSSAAAPSSSSEEEEEPVATSASDYSAPGYSAVEVAAAAITPAAAVENSPAVNVKTEIVYVTQYAEVKRHAHGHRHQHFRA